MSVRSSPPPPPATEYVRQDRPPPPPPPPLRTQGQAGTDWMPIVFIAFAVLFGFFAGLAAGR